ncbi:hypothetical protein CR513_47422, partial [Mucuna pruriens]
MTKAEWTIHLDEALEKSIRWYPRWNEREDVIIKCEGFSNVPLMGIQGAINYNPKLTLRIECTFMTDVSHKNAQQDIRKTKHSALQHKYATCVKSKTMEKTIEAFELQNQDLKGEVLTQTNSTITALANQNVAGYTQVGYTTGLPPRNTKDPPYRMSYGWNTKNPANDE